MKKMTKAKVLKQKYIPSHMPLTWLLLLYLLFDNLEGKLNPFYLGVLMTLLLFVHLLQWVKWLLHLFNTESPDIPELESLCICEKPKNNEMFTGPHHKMSFLYFRKNINVGRP